IAALGSSKKAKPKTAMITRNRAAVHISGLMPQQTFASAVARVWNISPALKSERGKISFWKTAPI
ncbi:Hypothetical protein FKW44_008837, partial [Caligus rogercresseyi]